MTCGNSASDQLAGSSGPPARRLDGQRHRDYGLLVAMQEPPKKERYSSAGPARGGKVLEIVRRNMRMLTGRCPHFEIGSELSLRLRTCASNGWFAGLANDLHNPARRASKTPRAPAAAIKVCSGFEDRPNDVLAFRTAWQTAEERIRGEFTFCAVAAGVGPDEQRSGRDLSGFPSARHQILDCAHPRCRASLIVAPIPFDFGWLLPLRLVERVCPG